MSGSVESCFMYLYTYSLVLVVTVFGCACTTQEIHLQLEFEKKGYILGEPVAGFAVVTNKFKEGISILDWTEMNNGYSEKGNLMLKVKDCLTGRELPVLPRKPFRSGGVVPSPYELGPGDAFRFGFILNNWTSVRCPGNYDVEGRLTLYVDLHRIDVVGCGSFRLEQGSDSDLKVVVDRLRTEFYAPHKTQNGNGDLRKFVIRRLRFIDSAESARLLYDIALDPSSDIYRPLALNALSLQGSKSAVLMLKDIIRSIRMEEVDRETAAWSLAYCRTEMAKKCLGEFNEDRNKKVRRAVIWGLSNVKQGWATNILRKMQNDTCPYNRTFVQEELEKRK
jgi:hypothetical protein